MLWSLVFIRFLLASTFRHDDVLASTTTRDDAADPQSAAAPAGAHAAPATPHDSGVHPAAPAMPHKDAGGPGSGAAPAGAHRTTTGQPHAEAGAPPPGLETADELHCRMFGVAKRKDMPCGKVAEDGCGCPVKVPQSLEDKDKQPPAFEGEDIYYVGWEEGTQDASTAITYSFEKEWVGYAPGLYRLYQPAGNGKEGKRCDELWAHLDDEAKAEFMAASWAEALKPNGAFSKYRSIGKGDKCLTKEGKHLPLRRSSTALSISDLIEVDCGAWEVKAATFFFSLSTMRAQVRKMIEDLDVPPAEPAPDGFPGERRIQVHVVAPLKRLKRDGDGPPAENKKLLRNLRLMRLYFSDFMFLRLGFPYGPGGAKCQSEDGPLFQCDVFSDRHNHVISKETADMAWDEEQDPVGEFHKDEIVGLRASNIYGGAEDNKACTPTMEDDCKTPYLVGFEIRKSESLASALEVAKAISLALSSMKTDGAAEVGMGQQMDIEVVREYAQSHRMKSFGDLPVCRYTNLDEANFDEALKARSAATLQPWVRAVARYAVYLRWTLQDKPANSDVKKKLWSMLALLLCTDWTRLVRVDASDDRANISAVRADNIPAKFQALEERYEVAHEKINEAIDVGKVAGKLEELHRTIVDYAYKLSTYF